jgi:uncharacterized Ntn-hydrolase superfamily protein
MKALLSILCFCAVMIASATAQSRVRPVHTFSIVARDPATGEIGAAVQSHWFAVGANVIWAEAGVGAVATQSFIDPSYGKLGLDLMRAGRSAPDSLRGLLAADANRDGRQVAMIDRQGTAAVFTGCNDIPAAGQMVGGSGVPGAAVGGHGGCAQAEQSLAGKDFSVQANLMLNDKVWPAMAKAFQETKGDLADRMLAALDAAQAVGGDIRGKQSAALIVVAGKSTGRPWVDRIFDLRVDDSPEPLKELRTLVQLQRAYNHMNAGDAAVTRKDNEAALREYGAAEQLASSTSGILSSRLAEMIYWHAVALVNMGRVNEALPMFKKVFAMDKNWATLTPRLTKVGLLVDDPNVLEQIMQQAR